MSKLEDYSAQIPIYKNNLKSSKIPSMKKCETPFFEEIQAHRPLPIFKKPNYYIRQVINPPKPERYYISEEDYDFFQTVYKEISVKNFEKLITLWEMHTNYAHAIPLEKAIDIAKYPNLSTVVNMYGYWTHRRKFLGASLLRSFWSSADREDKNIAKVFCKRKNEKMKLRPVKEREIDEKHKVRYN